MQERADLFAGVSPTEFRDVARMHKKGLAPGEKGAVTRLTGVLYQVLWDEASVSSLAEMSDKELIELPGIGRRLLEILDLLMELVLEEKVEGAR